MARAARKFLGVGVDRRASGSYALGVGLGQEASEWFEGVWVLGLSPVLPIELPAARSDRCRGPQERRGGYEPRRGRRRWRRGVGAGSNGFARKVGLSPPQVLCCYALAVDGDRCRRRRRGATATVTTPVLCSTLTATAAATARSLDGCGGRQRGRRRQRGGDDEVDRGHVPSAPGHTARSRGAWRQVLVVAIQNWPPADLLCTTNRCGHLRAQMKFGGYMRARAKALERWKTMEID
jgi:hypothetical protein